MRRAFTLSLLVFIMVVLFLPLLQHEFKIFKVNDALFGSFEKKQDTVLSVNNWFNREFQEKKENYVNENFGFRNWLVRLNNQVGFSFYGNINVKDVFQGKNNYLYSYRFFKNYSGISFKERYADSVFHTIDSLNKWLVSKNKKLLICFAPCKESYAPEFLPDSCAEQKKPVSFYTYYRQRIVSSQIPLLDYQDYFQDLKKGSKYPLFTQGAVHWTTYGANLALDTLLKRIGYETHKHINTIRIKSVEISDTARGGDDDISKAMNLFWDLNTEELGYPSLEFVYNKDSCDKPKVLLIGDSFYYGLNNTWVPVDAFSKESYFLYYFRQAIPYDPQKKNAEVVTIDFTKEIVNTDIVILFFSLGNLDEFPYGASSMMNQPAK